MLKKENIGIIKSLKRSLFNTSKNLGSGLIKLFKRNKKNNNLYEEIENKLIMADVGVQTSKKILDDIFKKEKSNDHNKIFELLKINMLKILKKVELPLIINNTPFILLIVGINGVGKTTTAAKIAYKYMQNGYSTMLVAADTFRTSAIDQIKILGKINNIPVFSKNHYDASSIIFDACNVAKKNNIDILIIDTAGRLHNKLNLMEELKKINKTIKKINNQEPYEIMLIIDSNIGQNSINQTNYFNRVLGITGITISKMDGSSKGGIIFNLAEQFKIPIRYICLGEKIEDLQLFQSNNFINALFY